jgi:hypothetical protein
MAKSPIKAVESGITKSLEEMASRTRSVQAYFKRIIYRQYQNAQRERWITENASEQGEWKRLDPVYEERKKRQFAAFPGRGEKMLIATGRLVSAVIGQPRSPEHRMTATNRSIEVAWTTPYAAYVDEVRPFSRFSEETMDEMMEGLGRFLVLNELRDVSRSGR